MKVYRIEHKEHGEGPFRNDDVFPRHYSMPEPIEDKVFGKDDLPYSEIRKFRFAFQDKDKLKKVFRKREIKALEKKKYKLMEYEVPWHLVYEGKSQCAFIPKESYKKRAVPLSRVYH